MHKQTKQVRDLTFYGKHAVKELIKHYPKMVTNIFVQDSNKRTSFEEFKKIARDNQIPLNTVATAFIEKRIGKDATHQGILASVKAFPYTEMEDFLAKLDMTTNPAVVVLDGIQDPHNLGAIIRSAAAFNISAVIIPSHNQVGITPSVIKASQGTAFHLPIIKIGSMQSTLTLLKNAGFWTVAMDTDGQDIDSVDIASDPTVIVIGGEGKGLGKTARNEADFIATIPTNPGVESLNASVGAAITFHTWNQTHRSHQDL